MRFSVFWVISVVRDGSRLQRQNPPTIHVGGSAWDTAAFDEGVRVKPFSASCWAKLYLPWLVWREKELWLDHPPATGDRQMLIFARLFVPFPYAGINHSCGAW